MLIPTTVTPLTIDTDNGRTHNYPCIVISPAGQQFVFYEKYLTTGKQSYSRITFTAPSFDISVEAGNGSVNATPVTWGSALLTINQNAYALVYVDTSGNVGLSYNLDMTFMKDVIQLAYVSSGNSSITRIEELEHTGYYIYLRKQTLSGSSYVWDNVAYRLNTGTQPKAFYCSTNGKIYLTYQKDGAEYVRVFDPTDELTWEYLPNTRIISNVISLINHPQNSVVFGVGSGYEAETTIENGDLFPLGDTGFCFVGSSTYIFLPSISGAYIQYITNPIITYEILNKVGSTYYVEASYSLDYHYILGRWKIWSGTAGQKYIRVIISTTIMTVDYVTDVSSYKSLLIYARPALTVVDTDISTDGRDDTLSLSASSGYEASVEKTAEFVETKTFQVDTTSLSVSSGYEASIEKTAEFVETKTFQVDTTSLSASSGYEADMTFVSY
jgi:hypothetical protein